MAYFAKFLTFCILIAYAFACGHDPPFPDPTGSICDGPNWVPFKDEKCFKLIQTWATRDNAAKLCQNEKLQTEEFSPTLALIKTQTEQKFLTQYIFEKSSVSINVWIGAKRDLENPNQFKWDDDSVVEFANWAPDRPTEKPERACVEMQAEDAQRMANKTRVPGVNGNWRDVTCSLPNYVVCEKLPRWSFGKLQKALIASRKQQIDDKIQLEAQLSQTQSELNIAKSQIVPIGFIYAQLPHDKPPTEIWPSMVWLNVSESYSGLFFRVTGGNAAPIGTIQDDGIPFIDRVRYDGSNLCDRDVWENYIQYKGGWSTLVPTGIFAIGGYINCNQYHMTSDEVRPRNMAMRVWKRIG